MKKVYSTIALLVCCLTIAQGQDSVANPAQIKVLARHQPNQNLIRWAPTTPSAFLKGKRYGYSLERYTFYRDGKRLSVPEKKVLNTAVILPKPVEQWEQIVNEDDYAAILAQALYGDSFAVDGGSSGEDALLQIINKSRESEQRFAFGLFAADMNFKAAVLAGLGWKDANIKPNEDYFYKVVPKTPKEILTIQSNGTLVKSSETVPLPKPIELFSAPQDKAITLTWNSQLFKNLYIAYYVERAPDGVNFKKVHNKPLVSMNNNEVREAVKMMYIDTIPANNTKYHYRIKGITSFGEVSPASEVVSNEGFKTLKVVPRITNYKLTQNNGVDLIWEFKKEAESEITGYVINKAPTDRGPYAVVKQNIRAAERTARIENLDPSNYFTVTAVGAKNQKTTSLPAFVQTIDSIPPAKPKGLVAKIDTTGIVNLNWKTNLEKDLQGYRVYRANVAQEEYVQLTVSPIVEATFQDNVQLKSLNDKVYYKVVAVDQRFNMSDYSEALMVKKPDVVPPSSPIFKEYKVTDGEVHLTWIKSPSADVAFYKLYRKELDKAGSNWELLFATKNESSYTDTELTGKERYRYAIFAEDETGLVSEASTPITLTAKASTSQPKLIKRVNGLADRTNNKIDLSWAVSDQVNEIVVYKAKNSEKPVLFRQLNAIKKEVEDTQINPGNRYEYTIRVSDGSGNVQFKKVSVLY